MVIFLVSGEIFLLKPTDEIAAITHIGDPVLLTVIAEEVKITRDEPPAMATTVQLALFLPERVNSPPYFENDQYVHLLDLNSLFELHLLALCRFSFLLSPNIIYSMRCRHIWNFIWRHCEI